MGVRARQSFALASFQKCMTKYENIGKKNEAHKMIERKKDHQP